MYSKYYYPKCTWCKEKISVKTPYTIGGYVYTKSTSTKDEKYSYWRLSPVRGRYCDDVCKTCDWFNRYIIQLREKQSYEQQDKVRKMSKDKIQRYDDMDICSFFK